MSERRRFKRVTYFTEAEYGSYEVKYGGKISDLSTGGAYIDTISPLPEKSIINVKFKLPSGKELVLKAIVKNEMPGMGMGIEFINLNENDQKELKDFIESGE